MYRIEFYDGMIVEFPGTATLAQIHEYTKAHGKVEEFRRISKTNLNSRSALTRNAFRSERYL